MATKYLSYNFSGSAFVTADLDTTKLKAQISASGSFGGDINVSKFVTVAQNLTYPTEGVDIVGSGDIEETYASVGLRQSCTVQTVLNPSAISYISLNQQAAPAEYVSVTSHIFLNQEVHRVYTAGSIIYLTQSASAETTTPVESVLELTHSVSQTIIVEPTASSTISLNSDATYFVVNVCEYMGTGPTLTRRSTTRLTYPYSSPTDTLDLRNPDFDNREQFEYRKINRKSRGGTLQIYRDSNWPEAERLVMTFSALTQIQVSELLTFLNKSLGKEIGLLDFESRQWRGVILTPSTPVNEEGSRGFSTTLQFEGTQV